MALTGQHGGGKSRWEKYKYRRNLAHTANSCFAIKEPYIPLQDPSVRTPSNLIFFLFRGRDQHSLKP
jgi:hypothetical protein